MTLQDIDEIINKKIEENDQEIVFTFFELRIKENLNKEETKLENLNYLVYKTGQSYIYNGEEKVVEGNQLLVALKKH